MKQSPANSSFDCCSNSMQDENCLHDQYILNKLREAKQQAHNPNASWIDHDRVWQMIFERCNLSK